MNNKSLDFRNTENKERINTLDFLRGFAILGMLVANIPWHVGNSMSRVTEANFTNVFAWIVQYLVFDQRFMPIFGMLFGAGFWILLQRANNQRDFSSYYLKRMAALLALGIAHAYLLWPGDILITYAVCGSLLLLFRHCSIKALILWGCLFKLINLVFGQWPEAYSLTLERILFSWWVSIGEAPMSAVQAYAGSYIDLLSYNAWRNQFLQWTGLPYFRIWNALGLMLIGIAMFRLGVLQGDRSRTFYKKMFVLTFALSLPLVIYGVFARIGINPSVGEYMGFNAELPLKNITFRLGCTIMSFSLLALVHLYWSNISLVVKTHLAYVGRMALTNYLLHSFFFVLVLHTFKLYPFDVMGHGMMWLFIILLWILHIAFSRFWLSRFSTGPAEYVYRKFISGNRVKPKEVKLSAR